MTTADVPNWHIVVEYMKHDGKCRDRLTSQEWESVAWLADGFGNLRNVVYSHLTRGQVQDMLYDWSHIRDSSSAAIDQMYNKIMEIVAAKEKPCGFPIQMHEFDKPDWDAFSGAARWADSEPLYGEVEFADERYCIVVADANGIQVWHEGGDPNFNCNAIGYARNMANAVGGLAWKPSVAKAIIEALGEAILDEVKLAQCGFERFCW